MKQFRMFFFITVLFLCTGYTVIHKYYISNTQIDYVEEQQSVQIVSRIFIDDLEAVLQERYDLEPAALALKPEVSDVYIEKYMSAKFKLKINGEILRPKYLGKKIEGSIVKCFLEVKDVTHIETVEISNQMLFDLFSQQQNIVKLHIDKIYKSYMLTLQKPKAFLILD